jgi:rhamnosyltransferase
MGPSEMFDAGIVLLTCNGEKYLGQLLEMLQRQKLRPSEIFAIDSSSTDGTTEILQKFGIPTTIIHKREFSHPGTRNLAARMCAARYVVFLTQDAVPADSCWLERLLDPFVQAHGNVAATFSRQIPRPGTGLLEASDVRQDFSTDRMVKRFTAGKKPDRSEIWRMIRFSNSSSAYDRNLLLQNPFDESLEMAEDQDWAKRMLEQDFSIIYEPSSVVLHSHDHGLKQKFERSLRMGRSFSAFLGSQFGKRSAFSEGTAFLAHIYLDFKYIVAADEDFRTKCKWIALSPLHRAAIHYAYRKGWNSRIRMESTVREALTSFT